MCKALPGLHSRTGGDPISSFAGISKKKALDMMLSNQEHQICLAKLGEDNELREIISTACESFICSLYTSSKKAGSKVDDVRFWVFCQKRQNNEDLPPTKDSLQYHMDRVIYQALVWKQTLQPMPNLPSPVGHAWELKDSNLEPVLMSKEPAPKGLLELTICN